MQGAETTLSDIEAYYGRYGASVLARCRQLVRDEATAWDAMHQTFIRAIKAKDTLREAERALPWLQTIALRVCLDELKRRRGPMELTDDVDGHLADPALLERHHDLRESQRAIAWLLPKFDDETRRVVVARFFDELEVADIARQTGLSERTVARRLADFLERARRLLTRRT